MRVSVTDPAADANVNVLGTIAVLEAARMAGTRRVVNSSTGGGLYGDADVLPTPEDHPIRPLAPYGQGKLAAEGYCDLYSRLHGLSTISLRYGNVYGPRQDVHGEAGVVAIFCGCLVDKRTPTVFGDGRQTRDWVDVSDVVRANLLAADSTLTSPVNIGHGRETAVLDLIEALNDVSGGAMPEPEFAPERPGEVGAAASTSPGPSGSWAGRRRCSSATDCGASWRTCSGAAADKAACRGGPSSPVPGRRWVPSGQCHRPRRDASRGRRAWRQQDVSAS